MRQRRLGRLACLGILFSLVATVFMIAPSWASGSNGRGVNGLGSNGPAYVALGDSYSSGVGTPGEHWFCLRSPQGYPALWAGTHRTSSFRLAACSGAVTDDVRYFQVWALSRATTTVTITIGGNDVGFADTMLTCTFASDARCLAALAQGTSQARTTLPAKLDASYAAIRRHAPNATVYVLGYPRLFEETASCPAGPDLTDRHAINAAADALSAVIAARAAAAGLYYVDVRSAFAGHGICGTTPWINAFGLNLNSFHPTAEGYRLGYLPALDAVTG